MKPTLLDIVDAIALEKGPDRKHRTVRRLASAKWGQFTLQQIRSEATKRDYFESCRTQPRSVTYSPR